MTKFRLIHAGIGCILSYGAFFAFMILVNYPAAVLAIISGASDNIAFFLHFLHRHNELHLWYTRNQLRSICRLGIIIATIGLLNLGYHTTIEIMFKKPILPIASSSVIPIIWSVIVLRSGLFLMYYCISYQSLENVALLDEEVENPQSEPVASSSTPNLRS